MKIMKKIWLTIKEISSFLAPLNFARLVKEIKFIWKDK